MCSMPKTYIEGFHNKEAVQRMKYNELGSTGMQVSQLSFGGGAFSAFYSTFDEDEAIETVREAIKAGVNYIDTAPWYGQGKSEELLGKALKGIPRQAYYIATKVGRYELDYDNMFNFTKEKVTSSFEDSLKKLGVDYVDIIQVHDIEFAPNMEIITNETLPCLEGFKKSGKAKHIGVTGYPLSVLKAAVESSRVKIDTILTYCRYSMIDTSLDDYADFFKKNNVGIIGAAAHAMGLLTNSGPQPWHPASASTKAECKKAAEYCKSKNIELGQLAMWHAINRKDVCTHLVGMNNRALLRANILVLQQGLNKTEQEAFQYLNSEYFSKIKNCHWEGAELRKYHDYLNNKTKGVVQSNAGFL